MSTPETAVSVIVPHYSDLKRLDRCLAALQRQTYPADRFEVIVADNQSPEGVEAVRAVVAGRARVILAPDKGAGPARNGGVAAAASPLLAFTDSDCVPEPGWLAAGLAVLPAYDFVGGQMKVFSEAGDRLSPEEAYESVFAFDNRDYVLRKKFTVTANLFCPAAVFARVGGFRTGVSEDIEWSNRATAMGCRIGYADEAIVSHPARRDWAELVKKWTRINAEIFQLYNLRPRGHLAWMARTALLPASALAYTPKVFFTRKVRTLRERLGALAVLYRLTGWRMVDSVRLSAHRLGGAGSLISGQARS